MHTEEKQFCCNKCDKSFTRQSSLNQHTLTHIDNNLYQCSKCTKSYTRKSYLKTHMMTHTGEDSYQCSKCNKPLSTTFQFQIHMTAYTNEDMYICSQCDNVNTSNINLEQHMEIDTTETLLQCHICDRSFTDSYEYNKHTMTHTVASKEQMLTDIDGEIHQSRQCDNLFRWESDDKNHIIIDTVEEQYQYELNSQMARHTIEETNQCSKFKNKFSSRNNLTQHMTPHTGENCSQSSLFNNSILNDNLNNDHKEIHTVEEIYQCSQCNKLFSKESDLKKHLPAHTGGDNDSARYSCSECDYECDQKSSLRNHLVAHKILICPRCDFFCKGKGKMRLHMQAHFDEISFSCKVCGTSFIKESEFTCHIKGDCGNKQNKQPEIAANYSEISKTDDQKGSSSHSIMFACTECDFTSTAEVNLKTHFPECSKKSSIPQTSNNELDPTQVPNVPQILNKKGISLNHLETSCRKKNIESGIPSNVVDMNSAQLPETVSIIDQTNNLDPITDISIDSESQIPNCEISCLHCIEIIRKNHLIQIANNNFETDLFKNNPLITKFGKDMYIELEKTEWSSCIVCKESHICFPLDVESKCEKCRGKGKKSHIFKPDNDLNPGEAPVCLTRLTPVEKSAISIICPSLTVVKCGTYSSKSKGHSISFYQNVQDLADTLPRLPQDLPYIVLKHPDERISDKTFQVRRQYLIEALKFLIEHSEDYQHINISEENCNFYPEDGIIQNLPQIHTDNFKMPHEAPSTDNPDSTIGNASTVDMPYPVNSVLENMESAIGETAQQTKHNWPVRSSCPVSEFIYVFFSKAFPDLFPYGIGDITKPRLGKNPTMLSYIRHLIRLNRRFVTHHCFIFVCTNIIRRHMALTLGNVFTKQSASDVSLSELKQAISENNDRIIKKLLYFAAPIPGTRQDLWYQSDKAVSLIRYVCISTNNERFFNIFHTVSAADLHWDDLHRLLPGSEAYLNKIVVKCMDDIPADEDFSKFIDQAMDYKLRSDNLKNYPDIVVTYLHHRVHIMLKFFWKPLGLKDYIIRYEVQNRGTMHAHMLLSLEKSISTKELQRAFMKPTEDSSETEKNENKLAKYKLIDFSVNTVGVSAIHPNPDPKEWPSPYGSNVFCPPQNCLRRRFLDINDMKTHYVDLINRVMIHKCRFGICLSNKRNLSNDLSCRFKFPMSTQGFDLLYDESGSKISSVVRNVDSPLGAEVVDEDLLFIRNHPTVVHHIPELLTVWCANVETRPVKSFEQVIRYILKYLTKPEPNSPPFETILKSVIEVADEDETVRKVLQKILMKTVGEHDLCLQECLHIINEFPFVEFSRKFVSVNVGSTRRVRTTGPDSEPAAVTNLADIYWDRSTNKHYNQLCDDFNSGKTNVNPEKISLYEFTSNYTKTWKYHGKGNVPHITPNFKKVPQKMPGTNDRYIMFLKNILLVHKAGSTYEEINSLDTQHLEISVKNFVFSDECPSFILEEYEKSQASECSEDESNDLINDDPLLREPEQEEVAMEQNEIMTLMKNVQIDDQMLNGIDYGYSTLATDYDADWEKDFRDFGFTNNDLKGIVTWLDKKKKENDLLECSQDNEPPTNLNKQQMNAFAIVKHFIDSFVDPNNQQVSPLLLQINGPPGTGKSHWIQKVKAYARILFDHNEFIKFVVQTAAPSGTAAFLVKGETLHSLLMLPIDYNSYKSLNSDRLYELQQKFRNIGILILDEKSMIGQRLFHMTDMRLREIFPQRREIMFGGLSIILTGDWKQLPPVGDSSLFEAKSRCPAGFNIYSGFKDVITFSKIERQTGESQKQFREELERLGEGKFTKDDWYKWKTRTFDLLSPTEKEDFNQNAILACSEKKNMMQHNLDKVKSNKQPIANIHAVSNCKAAKKVSSDKACGLLNELVVSKNSVVRLTANLWTKAGLTNGAKGIVRGIIYGPDSKPPALPICLIVTFEKYYGPSFIDSLPKSVPICPIRREWFSQQKSYSRTMLPLILGYALSIHKLQGETLEKVILNIGEKEFQTGLTFVGASRVKTFEGLAFKPFPNYDRFTQISKSETLQKRIKEEERLEVLHQNTLYKYNDIIVNCLKHYNWMD